MARAIGLAAAILCVFVTVALWRWAERLWRRQKLRQFYGAQKVPKYPHQDRLWGHDLIHQRQEAARRGHLLALYEKHFASIGKTFEENATGTPLVNTIHAENIQHVATRGRDDYGRSAFGPRAAKPLLGRSVMNADGAEAKYFRDLITPTFARSELSDLDSVRVFTDQLLERMPRVDGTTFDMQPLLHKMFLDLSTEFIFGEAIGAMSAGPSIQADRLLKALDRALRGMGERRRAGKLSWIRFMFDRSWLKACDEVHAYVDGQVRAALACTDRKLPSESGARAGSKRASKYVLLEEMAKRIRDPIELRYQILGVFMPARDTTSILVGNIIFQLARHPDIWKELHAIASRLDLDTLTFESLKSLAAFRYVVFETLRLQGPAGRVSRRAICDTWLPRGGGSDGLSPIVIKKGTIVAGHTWCLHRDPDNWGADVLEFKPERWIGKRPMWEFVPFWGGSRICPANQQVLTHAMYTLVHLTSKYSGIENRDPVLEYVEDVKMTTQSRNGVQIALTKSV